MQWSSVTISTRGRDLMSANVSSMGFGPGAFITFRLQERRSISSFNPTPPFSRGVSANSIGKFGARWALLKRVRDSLSLSSRTRRRGQDTAPSSGRVRNQLNAVIPAAAEIPARRKLRRDRLRISSSAARSLSLSLTSSCRLSIVGYLTGLDDLVAGDHAPESV